MKYLATKSIELLHKMGRKVMIATVRLQMLRWVLSQLILLPQSQETWPVHAAMQERVSSDWPRGAVQEAQLHPDARLMLGFVSGSFAENATQAMS